MNHFASTASAVANVCVALPCGVYGLSPVDRQRLVSGVEHVVQLGTRAVGELLIEVAAGDVQHLLLRLAAYQRLTPALVKALGADTWTAPLRPGRRPRSAS